MKEFLKIKDAPKTKLMLKKAILKGDVKIYECNFSSYSYSKKTVYKVLEKEEAFRFVINHWDSFKYYTKNKINEEEAMGFLGSSLDYKFKKTI